MSSSESMVVEAEVRGVGGEAWASRAAEAEILLLGWISLVDENVASAAFLLRVWGGMVTTEGLGDSNRVRVGEMVVLAQWDLARYCLRGGELELVWAEK